MMYKILHTADLIQTVTECAETETEKKRVLCVKSNGI
jgi:hypothetical protein